MENKKAAAVILAAGYSSRMGEFKPLLPVGSKSAIENLIDAFINAGISEIVVVTGHNREPLSRLIAEINAQQPPVIIKEAYNSDFDKGMFSSIKTGIRAIIAESVECAGRPDGAQDASCDAWDGIFLLPVDYPLIRPEHLALLYDEARLRPENFIAPCYRGKKGHPLWIPKVYWPEILDYTGDGGLKAITGKYDDLGRLYRLEVQDEAVVLDMDTPAGYQEILEYQQSSDFSQDFRGRILLIRHGRTEQHTEKIFLGQTDVPLSTDGRHDAFVSGQELAELKPLTDVIYTSDLVRASESAEIIKTTLGLAADGYKPEIIKVPEFREMSLGDWDGRFISEVKAEFPEEYEKRGQNKLIYKRGHDDENFYDLQYRVMKKLKKLVKSACLEGKADNDIIIVAHRGVIKVIICNLLGYDLEAMETFDVPRGSITNLDYRIKTESGKENKS